MSTSQNPRQARREYLFDLYSKNWSVVRRHPFMQNVKPDTDDIFVCPVCFKSFSRSALTKTQVLTLEHIPPGALGGRDADSILLCGGCNHEIGSKLDSQLDYRLMAADFLNRVPGASIEGQFSLGEDAWLPTTFTWTETGKLDIDTDGSPKRSHPKVRGLHEERAESLKRTQKFDGRLSFSIGKRREWETALLRIAYLMLFKTFGYGALVPPTTQRVRHQIRNPQEDILPRSWMLDDVALSIDALGANIIVEPDDLRSFLLVFELATDLVTSQHAVVLPCPEEPGLSVYERLQQRRDSGEGISFEGECIPDTLDYILQPELCFASVELWHVPSVLI